MKARLAKLWLAAIGLSLALPAYADERSAVLFPEDGRLARQVTVRRPRVYLGELLAELSRQGRVPLTVDEQKAPNSGIELCAFLRKRALRDAMRSISVLLSHRFNRWEWRPVERRGYRLVCQRSHEAVYGSARASILDRWKADVRTCYEISRLPPEQRRVQALTRPDLFPAGWRDNGKQEVLAALSPAQVEALLRGSEVTIDSEKLPPAARSALTLGHSGPGLQGLPSTSAGLYVAWDSSSTGPVLWLRNTSGMAGNVVGGLAWDSGWLRDNGEGWVYPWSPEAKDFGDRQVRDANADGTRVGARSMWDWLKLAAEKQETDLLADPVYPMGGETYNGAYIGKTPELTAIALVVFAGMLTTRDGDVRLFRHQTALFHPRRHLVPLKLVQELRRDADTADKCLAFPALLKLSKLRSDQLGGLFEEFPNASNDSLADWRPVLEFYQHLTPKAQEALRSVAGLPIRDAGLVARAALTEGPDPRNIRGLALLDAEFRRAVVSLRVEGRVPPAGALPGSRLASSKQQLVWRVRIPDGPEHVGILPLQPRRPLKPE